MSLSAHSSSSVGTAVTSKACGRKGNTKKKGMVLTIVTVRKAREEKRKMARDADKATIESMRSELERLRSEIRRWEQWWYSYAWHSADDDWHRVYETVGDFGGSMQPVHELGLSLAPCTGRAQETPAGRVIDYSRWDHLSCYSSCDSVALEETEEEEVTDECATGEAMEDERDDATDVLFQFGLGQADDFSAEDRAQPRDEDDAMRKRRVIDALSSSGKALQTAFHEAAERLDSLPKSEGISAALKGQQEQVSLQMANYEQSIVQMRDSEFSIDGTPQILQLIASWRDELLSGIASLVQD